MAFVILPLPDEPDDQNVAAFCALLRHERAELEVDLALPIERSFLSPSTMPSAAILDLADRAW